jgi:hypothetical protein
MEITLVIVLMLGVSYETPQGPSGPRHPITVHLPMSSSYECLSEVHNLIVKYEAMRRPGFLSAGCRVTGPEREGEH